MVSSPDDMPMRHHGLPRKLRIAFILQAVMVSLAIVLGVYLISAVIKHSLMNTALQEEAAHFWQLYSASTAQPPPNTYNLRGYLVLKGHSNLVLDPVSMRATRGGTELMLSPLGLPLLTILMRESPRVVTRQEIEREIWGNGLPDSDTLRSHLYNLRKVIDKPFDKPLLHTVQSAGYRIADIDQSPA